MFLRVDGAMILCPSPGKDVVAISRALEDVKDWEKLAALLNINSIEIMTDCVHDLSLSRCYRRELVRRYCDNQQFDDSRKVAENIAAELERMGNALQGKQLRVAFSLGGLILGVVTNTMSLFMGCPFQALLW